MTKSKFLKLNLTDFQKGLIVAVLGVILQGGYQLLVSGGAITRVSIILILKTGLIAGVSYLLKNFFQNANGDLLQKDVQ